ncbi:TetR family transcriptional regulator [Caulobacter sp. SLTY]|uniref:TetR/AcrR family transcriptional regulator n=1 Tax=Caulobacter sp. SLTY TaxID=2683262 RepID=UPI001411F3E0|nr:TetR/AcrR family transcriptional regulator [Caulobacter sp. SLTY]NBB14763.1 TetR family transcriptional regulator [Caulobacter sp. SLTY]
MGVRDAQKAATREKVLSAARDLFHEIGYEETTIRAIADRAGVSVGSVFTTFSSKADVLSQVMADRVEPLQAELVRVLPYLRGSTADRICSIFAIHYDFECRRVKLFLAHIAASFSPSLEETTIPFGRNQGFRGMLLDILAEGITRGDIRPDADLDLVLECLMAAYAWNYSHAAQLGADAVALTARMDKQVHIILSGVRPQTSYGAM